MAEQVQLWWFVAISALTAAVNLGIYLQSHKEYGRRISTLNARLDQLDEEKIDASVHTEVVKRIDSHLLRIERAVNDLGRQRGRA